MTPSQERPWTRYYRPSVDGVLSSPVEEKTVWDFIENAFGKFGPENDALIYFGRRYGRDEFRSMVYQWARVLRGMDLRSDEQIMVFSPFTPEIAALLFAADMTGITAIFPNLSASHRALEGSMGVARVAFAFDVLEEGVHDILLRGQFEHIVLIDAMRGMPAPLKAVLGTVNKIKTRHILRSDSRFMTVQQALDRFGGYQGELRAPHKEGRVALVCSSGGTTSKGNAKQICLTDAAMLEMCHSCLALNENESPFRVGEISYCNLPPFVCTSLFVLLIAPLYMGMTVVLEPRLNVETFTKNLLKYRPQITLIPGKCWEGFFLRVEKMLDRGKKVDLSFFRCPIMGGEGCTPEQLRWMDGVMKRGGSRQGIVSGYGMSEAFSVVTVDWQPGHLEQDAYDCPAISVGYPLPGACVGIFDEDGNELGYGQRGEVRYKTPAHFSGYLGNEELFRKVYVDGWVRSGDYGELSPEGQLYVYGRMQDHVLSEAGEKVYLFDIANRIRADKDVKESMACNMTHDSAQPKLTVHLILEKGVTDENAVLKRIHDDMCSWLPEGLEIYGYKTHEGPFRMSIVCKVDHNSYDEETVPAWKNN